jgi:hypothetical protein
LRKGYGRTYSITEIGVITEPRYDAAWLTRRAAGLEIAGAA